jgi:hypothetical protein
MFDRINSGGLPLNPMETRRGVRQGPFINFVEQLAAEPLLRELAPLSPASVKRRDYDELVARFFAYTDRYEEFDRSVIEFINDYIDERQKSFDPQVDGPKMRDEWLSVLQFVGANFKYGFRKGPTNNRTPRVRFEAIAVGVALAMRQNPNLKVDANAISEWAYGEEFNKLVASDGSNSRPRIKARIEYVRDRLLTIK